MIDNTITSVLFRKRESLFMVQPTATTHLYQIIRKPPLSLTHAISTYPPLCYQELRHTLHVSHITTLTIFLLDLWTKVLETCLQTKMTPRCKFRKDNNSPWLKKNSFYFYWARPGIIWPWAQIVLTLSFQFRNNLIQNHLWPAKCNGYLRKRSRHNLNYLPGVFLVGWKKTTKNVAGLRSIFEPATFQIQTRTATNFITEFVKINLNETSFSVQNEFVCFRVGFGSGLLRTP